MIIPICHVHVKIIEKKEHCGHWFALMQNHTGEKMWVEQPRKPKISEEQILYIIKGESSEAKILENGRRWSFLRRSRTHYSWLC